MGKASFVQNLLLRLFGVDNLVSSLGTTKEYQKFVNNGASGIYIPKRHKKKIFAKHVK